MHGIPRWTPPFPEQGYRLHSPSPLPFLPYSDGVDLDSSKFAQEHIYSPDIHDGITAVLPVTLDALSDLETNVDSLLSAPSSILYEIIVACNPNILVETERVVKNLRTSSTMPYIMTVLPWSLTDSQSLGILHVLPSVFTTRVLMLGASALQDLDDTMRMRLLDTAPLNVPIGPNGILVSPTNVSCIHSAEQTVPAAYLVPPFLSPTVLLTQAENGMRLDAHTWAALGDRVTKIAGFGGLVMSTSARSHRWCFDALTSVDLKSTSTFLPAFYALLQQNIDRSPLPARLNILLPGREDLDSFGPSVCEMMHRGHVVRIILFSWSYVNRSTHFVLDVGCHLHFETISRHSSLTALSTGLKAWIRQGNRADVLMYASQTLTQTMTIENSLEGFRFAGGTVVHLPVGDLPFCQWMAMLGASEWQSK